MSGVGGIVYDKDAVYIDVDEESQNKDKKVVFSQTDICGHNFCPFFFFFFIPIVVGNPI